MLGEPAVLDADDVGGDPGSGSAIAGEAPARDHASPSATMSWFSYFSVLARANQVEQSIAARRDMGAVLDVAI